MYYKILESKEKIIPELSATLFDPELIEDLLVSDISGIINELHRPAVFSTAMIENFWLGVKQKIGENSSAGRLALKYSAAHEKYEPEFKYQVKTIDQLSLPEVIAKMFQSREAYAYLRKIVISLPEMANQQLFYQNKFHPEGNVLVHTDVVIKGLITLISKISPALANDGFFSQQVRDLCDDQYYSFTPKTRLEIRESVTTRIDGVPRARLLLLAGLFHDIGKPQASRLTIINGQYKIFKLENAYYFDHKFSDHEAIGAKLFLTIAPWIGLTTAQTDFVYELILCHKDITDAVKNARKSDNREFVLWGLIEDIKKKYSQKNIFYEAVLLFCADNIIGKTSVSGQRTPDYWEMTEAFNMLLRAK